MTITPTTLPNGKQVYLAQEYQAGRLILSVTGNTPFQAIANAFKELTKII